MSAIRINRVRRFLVPAVDSAGGRLPPNVEALFWYSLGFLTATLLPWVLRAVAMAVR